VFRLDDALGEPEVAARQGLVDRPAIQANYRKRVTGGAEALPAAPGVGDVMVLLQRNLQRLGGSALSQAITLE
jgi:hypothetical protein